MKIENQITAKIIEAITVLFDTMVTPAQAAVQKTKSEFVGDFTLVVFPFVKAAKLSPENTAQKIGEWLQKEIKKITHLN